MFSNFEPLRGLEPRTHALRRRNMVLKISELDGRMEINTEIRQKIKKTKNKIRQIYDGGLFGGWGGGELWIGGIIFAWFAGMGLAGMIGR